MDIKNKKGAMEMSMGTIVTIVLLMSVLVLGIFLVQKIFTSGTNAIDGIDKALEDEIKSLFSQGSDTKVLVYPKEGYITLKKGDQGGFAISVRNMDTTGGTFTYEVSIDATGIGRDCHMTHQNAIALISLGRTGSAQLGSGDIMPRASFVRFDIPDTAPLCLFRFNIDVKKDGRIYSPTIAYDVEIIA